MPTAPFRLRALDEGNGILFHLFGSRDLLRAVFGQAAQENSIGQDVLKQILPVVVSMAIGGLVKRSTGQMQPAGGFKGGNNPLGEIIEQVMRQGDGMIGGGTAPQQAPQKTQAQGSFKNPFGSVLKDMFGGEEERP